MMLYLYLGLLRSMSALQLNTELLVPFIRIPPSRVTATKQQQNKISFLDTSTPSGLSELVQSNLSCGITSYGIPCQNPSYGIALEALPNAPYHSLRPNLAGIPTLFQMRNSTVLKTTIWQRRKLETVLHSAGVVFGTGTDSELLHCAEPIFPSIQIHPKGTNTHSASITQIWLSPTKLTRGADKKQIRNNIHPLPHADLTASPRSVGFEYAHSLGRTRLAEASLFDDAILYRDGIGFLLCPPGPNYRQSSSSSSSAQTNAVFGSTARPAHHPVQPPSHPSPVLMAPECALADHADGNLRALEPSRQPLSQRGSSFGMNTGEQADGCTGEQAPQCRRRRRTLQVEETGTWGSQTASRIKDQSKITRITHSTLPYHKAERVHSKCLLLGSRVMVGPGP
ncbi:hypothetical protein C8R45DRAFT_1154193 [Mycena sanguinolenta]|nr:hypothetical protein C8R45DRAFT_1154193 [Mycena sanguinolenta]